MFGDACSKSTGCIDKLLYCEKKIDHCEQQILEHQSLQFKQIDTASEADLVLQQMCLVCSSLIAE